MRGRHAGRPGAVGLALLTAAGCALANTNPEATLMASPNQQVPSKSDAVTVANFLTNVRPGAAGASPPEDGQVVCNSGTCACTVVGTNFFNIAPYISLADSTPTTAMPTTGTLVFSIRIPLEGFPQTAQVTCELTDDSGGSTMLDPFDVTVTGLTWTVKATTLLSCVEDTPCAVDPLYDDLNDNNMGMTAFDPANFYRVTSDDPRWTDGVFFKTKPTLATAPTTGCTACSSALNMDFLPDVNTNGQWAGKTGPIEFSISIYDAEGNRATKRTFSLVVGGINDPPTATLATNEFTTTYGDGNVMTYQYEYPNVVTNSIAGPTTALDEAMQGFVTDQECTTDKATFFDGDGAVPKLTYDMMGNAKLTWTFDSDLVGGPAWTDWPDMMPAMITLTCGVTDSLVSSTVLPPITLTVFPVNTNPLVSCGGCASMVAEDATAVFADAYSVDPSTPAGLAWEASQTVSLATACTVASTTCQSTTGGCCSARTISAGSATGKFTLTCDVVPDAVGTETVECTFKDDAALTHSAQYAITFNEVNDAPTATFTGGTALSSLYSDTNTVTKNSFLSDVRVGGTGAVSEDGQMLTATCTNDDNMMFTTQPTLTLAAAGPTQAMPTTAALSYAFAAGLANTERTATVTCEIEDDQAPPGVYRLPAITITATAKPMFDITSATITCNEDNNAMASTTAAQCSLTGLLTNLDDNNMGMNTWNTMNCPAACNPLATPCPDSTSQGGGGAELPSNCWYSFTTNDPRYFNYKFIQVRPMLTGMPSMCTAGSLCSSDLVLQMGVDANTKNTPLPLTMTIQDALGNQVVRQVELVITPVNDNPMFTQVTTAEAVQAVTTQQVHDFLTDVRPGPVTATDEDGQVITATCTTSNNAAFSTLPNVVFASTTPSSLVPTTAQLTYTLQPVTMGTFPLTINIDCTVNDDQGGSLAATQLVLTVNPGPPTFNVPEAILSCFEDNSPAASLTATACTFAGALTDINDNAGGAAGFNAGSYYTLASNDPRWDTMFSVRPALTAPATAPCTMCTADVSFTLVNDFNTGTSTVPFTIFITNANGLSSDTRTMYISVTPVNDLPTASGGMDVTIDYTEGTRTIASHYTNILPGPPSAADEATQTVNTATCVPSGALFKSGPMLVFGNGAADLQFEIADGTLFPASNTVTCDIKDAEMAVVSSTFTVTIENGPPFWTPVSTMLTANEDSNPTASTGTAARTVVSGFVTSLGHNDLNDAAFDGTMASCDPTAPKASCWYTITPANPSLFAEMPVLENLVCAAGMGTTCTADMAFTPVGDTSGMTSVEIVIRNVRGFAAPPVTVMLTIEPVNDMPMGQLVPPSDQNVMFNNVALQTVAGFVEGISPGPNEASQTITATCTNSNNGMFSTLPRLTLTAGGTASLEYALSGGSMAATATVVCSLEDSEGLAVVLPSFEIRAGVLPTFTGVTYVSCFEDGTASPSLTTLLQCFHTDFVTFLNDGNSGASSFSTAGCPGGPTCWYNVYSSDPQWDALFSVKPSLSPPTTPCTGMCTSELRYTLSNNANTAGRRIPFLVTITGSNGATSAVHRAELEVISVNDPPVATYVTQVYPNGLEALNQVPDFLTMVSGGPSADEQTQVVSATCTGSPPGYFASAPTLTFDAVAVGTATLSYQLTTPAPTIPGAIDCVLRDSASPPESSALDKIIVGRQMKWDQLAEVTCPEDGSTDPVASPLSTWERQCIFRQFISNFDDNYDGASTFASFTFTSPDATFPTQFDSAPDLTLPIQFCRGTCQSDLGFATVLNFNGELDVDLTIVDGVGRSLTRRTRVKITPVNDYPIWNTPVAEVVADPTDLELRSYEVVTGVYPGPLPVGQAGLDEDGQTLCNGGFCGCQGLPDIFEVDPYLSLDTTAPTFAGAGATGSVLFTLQAGLAETARSVVTCTVTDGTLTKSLTFVVSMKSSDATETRCAPYVFADGVVGNGGDPCLDGIGLLSTQDPSCGVACGPGYTGTSTTITCPAGMDISCVASPCASGPGNPGANVDYTGCNALTTGSICKPVCNSGYHRTSIAFELTCQGGAYTDITGTLCEENMCWVSLPVGAVPAATLMDMTRQQCTNGLLMSSPREQACEYQCADGYIQQPGTLLVLQCPMGAAHYGTLTHADQYCEASCLQFADGCGENGYLRPDASTVACTGGVASGCDYATCCFSRCSSYDSCDAAAGYVLKREPQAIDCAAAMCTREQCCDITCADPAFTACSATGFQLRQPALGTRCDQARGCDVETCCVATCDNTEFTSCRACGQYTLRDDAANAACAGGNAARDCTIDTCCIPTCANPAFSCDAGQMKKPNAALLTCNAVTGCTQELCCVATCKNSVFRCNLPATLRDAPETRACANNQLTSCSQATCCDDLCAGVTCTPENECHFAGACTAGRCSQPIKPDSTPCSVGICMAGNCVAPVQCGDVSCNVNACVSAECDGMLCVPKARAAGTVCTDNNPDTFDDKCAAGVCVGVDRCKSVLCQPMSQCHDAGVCDPTTGMCSHLMKADGAICDDGDATTMGDRCERGVCKGTCKCSNVHCGYQVCHVGGTCDPTTGRCAYSRVADYELCQTDTIEDGWCLSGVCVHRRCNCVGCGQCELATCDVTGNVCSASVRADGTACALVSNVFDGVCRQGTCAVPDRCDDVMCPMHTAQCLTQSMCHPQTGMCTDPMMLPDFTPCDDGLEYTAGDVCMQGVCKGTPACQHTSCPLLQCKAKVDCCATNGACVYVNAHNGIRCDDGKADTVDVCLEGTCVGQLKCGSSICVADECRIAQCVSAKCTESVAPDGTLCNSGLGTCKCGACVAKNAATCDGVVCVASSACHEVLGCHQGVCVETMRMNGYPCDDGDINTFGDTCMNGACVGSRACSCPANECMSSSACAAGESTCVQTPLPDGTTCSGGQCENGMCVQDIACGTSCRALPCHVTTCRDGVTCMQYCLPEGTPCNDGNAKTTKDVCMRHADTGDMMCMGVDLCRNEAGVCAPMSQCHLEGMCDPLTGKCTTPMKPDGSPCDDDDDTTTDDSCRSGACVGTPKCNRECAALPCGGCTECHPMTGECIRRAHPDGTVCDDLNNATTHDMCINGACKGSLACGIYTCTTSKPCMMPVCSVTQTCTETPMPNGSPCSDTNNYYDAPVCIDGQCVQPKGNPCDTEICTALSVCHDVGVCTLLNGVAVCTNPVKPDYTPCDDMDAMTVDDMCIGGSCVGRSRCQGECPTTSQCYVNDGCDPMTGVCATSARADGSRCNDGNPATVDDVCKSGGCVGGVLCGSRTCYPLSPCHSVTCTPLGDCEQAVQAGRACDDGDPATMSDTCDLSAECRGVSRCDSVRCVLGPCDEKAMCNPHTGECWATRKLDGTPCDAGDGVLSLANAVCRSGTCTGFLCDNIDCSTPPDECRMPGVCNPLTGTCEYANQANGMPCDDSSLLTSGDQCVNGICVGTDACLGVTCTAYGECFEVGECFRGVCTNPYKPDNTPCGESGAGMCMQGMCSTTLRCQGVICEISDQCHVMGVCDEATGLCTDPKAPDSRSCDDGKPETYSDKCVSGMCKGVVTCGGSVCTSPDPCHVAFCSGTTCTQQPLDNEPCNDENPETFDDMCVNGRCVGTRKCDTVVCGNTDLCKSNPVCDPATGACKFTAVPDGSPCDDGNDATLMDVCEAGVCKGVIPCATECLAESTCYVNGKCDVMTGTCPSLRVPDGTVCDDGNANTVADKCEMGVCTGKLYCDGITECVVDDSCKRPVCEGAFCRFTAMPDGTPCSDNLQQTTNDTCRAGVCIGVAYCTTECVPLSQCHEAGECLPNTGQCQHPIKPDGTPCDDSDETTSADQCMLGKCMGTAKCTGVTCPARGDCQLEGVCDPATGLCMEVLRPDNTPCDDGLVDTTGDVCLEGFCTGSLPCGDQSCYSTSACVIPQCTAGVCTSQPRSDNTLCSDGRAETFDDMCMGGTCVGVSKCEGVVCGPRSCFEAACDPATGACAYSFLADFTPCDDGKTATIQDVCRQGVCEGTTRCADLTCTPLSQCHTAGACDAEFGVCTTPRLPDGTPCDDGDPLTVIDTCNEGYCSGMVECGTAQCYSKACEIAGCLNDVCTYAYRPDGTPCDDGKISTFRDECRAGICVGVDLCIGVSCDPTSYCQETGVCDPTTGQCMYTLKADGSPCDDKDPSTYRDRCTKGMCMGDLNCAGVECFAGGPCGAIGVCDAATSVCSEPILPDTTPCDDGNVLSTNDRCDNGVCVGQVTCGMRVCEPAQDCYVAFCGAGDVCGEVPKKDGSPCTDRNPLTLNDRCTGGKCVGDDLCAGVSCLGDGQCVNPSQCDPKTGKCFVDLKPDNSPCDDGRDETIDDHCLQGTCVGYAPCENMECDLKAQCYTSSRCNVLTSSCEVQLREDGTECSDGDLSTYNDICRNGECLGEVPCNKMNCTARGQCYRAICDFDICKEEVKEDGTTCDDADPRTIDDFCVGGVCAGRDPCAGVDCSGSVQCRLDGACYMGRCLDRFEADRTPCDDGLAATAVDHCIAGSCVAQLTCGAVECVVTDPQCHYSACSGVNCIELKKPDDTPCDDGVGSSANDRCLDGVCVDTDPCRSVACVPLSQCHDKGNCAGAGVCTDPVKPSGFLCDDGDATTGGDQCNAAGACVGVNKCLGVVCTRSDACHLVGVCNPTTGLCSDPIAVDGTPCNDGDAASIGDQCRNGVCAGIVTCGTTVCPLPGKCESMACDGSRCVTLNLGNVMCNDNDILTEDDRCVEGQCVGRNICDGVVCPPSTECHLTQCEAGRCTTTMVPDNTICNDGDAFTVNDRCTAGVCMGENPCALGQCGQICVGQPDGTPCDDGRSNSVDDRCVSGVCVGTFKCSGVTCEPISSCHYAGECNFITGLCTTPPKPDGGSCSDNDPTTEGDVCSAQVCTGRVRCGDTLCLPAPQQCMMTACDGNNQCVLRPKFDDVQCSDGNPATTHDMCKEGTCVGRELCRGVTCAAAGECYEVGECDPMTGRCSEVYKPTGVTCSGGTCKGGNCLPAIECGGSMCAATTPCDMPSCTNGVCEYMKKPDYTLCSDGRPDTQEDHCLDGVCRGTDLCAVAVCTLGQCRALGECDPETGVCASDPRRDGTTCTDGSVATTDDMCLAGYCIGVDVCDNGARCFPATECQVAMCEPGGGCTEMAAPDGTPCSDGNDLTYDDACAAGKCEGVNRCMDVSCEAPGVCFISTGCDPRNGRCNSRPYPDGTACTDPVTESAGACHGGACVVPTMCNGVLCGAPRSNCHEVLCIDNFCRERPRFDGMACTDDNPLTYDDRCFDGVCRGRGLCEGVLCRPADDCVLSYGCNPGTGQCTPQRRQEATPCNDFDPATIEDRCVAGLCRGLTICDGVECPVSNAQCFVAGCGEANECMEMMKPSGTPCDDGLTKTVNDICDESGVCYGRDLCEDVSCSTGSECVISNGCDSRTGLCIEINKMDGAPCFDGVCLGGACVKALSCGSGAPCIPADPQCTYARCNGAVCINTTPKPDGTPCSDNNALTHDDVCQRGVCVGKDKCAGVVCKASTPCRAEGTCDPATGFCSEPYLNDGTPCDDNNPLSQRDTCRAGTCVGVTPCGTRACEPTHAQCMMSTCLEDSLCGEMPRYDGTLCNDNDPTTVNDMCKDGMCVGTDLCEGVVCNPDNTVEKPCHGLGSCDPMTGLCRYPKQPDGTQCEVTGTCAAGVCVQPITCDVACPATTQCKQPVCGNGAAGPCTLAPKDGGAPCNDGMDHTLNDVCIDGTCTGLDLCRGVVCPAATDCEMAAKCNPNTGICEAQPKPEGTPCNDRDNATRNDVCMAGTCVGVVSCGGQQCLPSKAQCRRVVCEIDTCKEIMLSGMPCNDRDPLSTNDMCYDGECRGARLCEGVVCEPKSECYDAGTCDVRTGQCSMPVKNYTTPCNDNDPDTVESFCLMGACVGAARCDLTQPGAPLCMPRTSCERAVCNGTACMRSPAMAGTSCDDFNPLTAEDTCFEGACRGTDLCSGVLCPMKSECHTQGVCDPATGFCKDDTLPDGTACGSDTRPGTCMMGTCTFPVMCASTPCSIADPRCKEPFCIDGVTCAERALPNGTPCDDMDPSTHNDRCAAGVCAGAADAVCTRECAPRECKVASACDGTACVYEDAPDGAPCGSGVFACSRGVCLRELECGTKMCAPNDPCKTPICLNDVCIEDVMPDGTMCDDGNPLTSDDICVSGTCAGVNKCAGVVCGLVDTCHEEGECDRRTGQCRYARRPSGTRCNDGVAASINDECADGFCRGTVSCGGSVCAYPSSVCKQIVCSNALCTEINKADGTQCNDERPETGPDMCMNGMCMGFPPTCANGTIRELAVQATTCEAVDNAATVTCPFGVCDSKTCCASCAQFPAEQCPCNMVIPNPSAFRCPVGGCNVDHCCRPGLFNVSTTMFSSKSVSELEAKRFTDIPTTLAEAFGVPTSAITDVMLATDSGVTKMTFNVAHRTTLAISTADRAVAATNTRIQADLANTNNLRGLGVYSGAASTAAGVNVKTVTSLNITLAMSRAAFEVEGANDFRQAVAEATKLPAELISNPVVVAERGTPVQVDVRVLARPCGFSHDEAGDYITGMLALDEARGADSVLDRAGFPYVAATTSLQPRDVRATVSILVTTTLSETELEGAMLTYLAGVSGVVQSTCRKALPEWGANTYRVEAVVTESGGVWDATQFAHALRKAVSKASSRVVGVSVDNVQAEPTEGDCKDAPCGCGVRCTDDLGAQETDGSYTCECRYPYSSQKAASAVVTCASSALDAVRAAQTATPENKDAIARDLGDAVREVVEGDELWGDGAWVDQAIGLVKDVADASGGTLSSAAEDNLLAAAVGIAAHQRRMWQKCCAPVADPLDAPATCCGEIVAQTTAGPRNRNLTEALSRLVVRGAPADTATLEPRRCDSSACIDELGETATARAAASARGMDYVKSLHMIGDTMCGSIAGRIGNTAVERAGRFEIHAVIIPKGSSSQPLNPGTFGYMDTATTFSTAITAPTGAPEQMCRCTVASRDVAGRLEGDGWPHLTPVGTIVSVHYTDPAMLTPYTVGYEGSIARQVMYSDSDAFEVCRWDEGGSGWTMLPFPEGQTPTLVDGRVDAPYRVGAASSAPSTATTRRGTVALGSTNVTTGGSRRTVRVLQAASASANNDIVVAGISEYSWPDRNCFPCIALPIVWGTAVLLALLGFCCAQAQKGPSNVQPVVSRGKAFLLAHVWLRIFVPPAAKFTKSTFTKFLIFNIAWVFAWGFTTVFYSNEKCRYGWAVTWDNWVAWSVLCGFAAFVFTAFVDIPSEKSPMHGILVVFGYLSLAGLSVAMYFNTDEYNTWEQEERYVVTFVLAMVFHCFVFEMLRAFMIAFVFYNEKDDVRGAMEEMKSPPGTEPHNRYYEADGMTGSDELLKNASPMPVSPPDLAMTPAKQPAPEAYYSQTRPSIQETLNTGGWDRRNGNPAPLRTGFLGTAGSATGRMPALPGGMGRGHASNVGSPATRTPNNAIDFSSSPVKSGASPAVDSSLRPLPRLPRPLQDRRTPGFGRAYDDEGDFAFGGGRSPSASPNTFSQHARQDRDRLQLR